MDMVCVLEVDGFAQIVAHFVMDDTVVVVEFEESMEVLMDVVVVVVDVIMGGQEVVETVIVVVKAVTVVLGAVAADVVESVVVVAANIAQTIGHADWRRSDLIHLEYDWEKEQHQMDVRVQMVVAMHVYQLHQCQYFDYFLGTAHSDKIHFDIEYLAHTGDSSVAAVVAAVAHIVAASVVAIVGSVGHGYDVADGAGFVE